MAKIIRVTTQNKVYFLGDHLPVPEGTPLEPFLINEIVWDQDNGKIEFVCFPDVQAAQQMPKRTDEEDGVWKAIEHYHASARQYVEDRLVLSAVISDEHARVESVMEYGEYEQIMRDMQSDESDESEETEPPQAEQVQPELKAETLTTPSPALPPEVSVQPDAE